VIIGRNLRPRAIAALVALRNAPLSVLQLRNSIADPSGVTTRDLLREMRDLKLVGQVDGDQRWYLDSEGVVWLHLNGLDADPTARLLVVRGAIGVAS
jgi:hypothetical protein